MAKPYNYLTNAEYSFYSFGVLVKPHCGVVETTWKVPVKYHNIAKAFIDTHFNHADQPAIKYENIVDSMVVTFIRNIDLTQIFADLKGSSLTKYNQIITGRDIAINEACYQVTLSRESFQDMIRGKFYTQRFVVNAPSIP